MSDHSSLDRRSFVGASLAAGAAILGAPLTASAASVRGVIEPAPRTLLPQRDELFERTVVELGEMMQRGALTSRALTQRYLSRVEAMDKRGKTATCSTKIDVTPVRIIGSASIDSSFLLSTDMELIAVLTVSIANTAKESLSFSIA